MSAQHNAGAGRYGPSTKGRLFYVPGPSFQVAQFPRDDMAMQTVAACCMPLAATYEAYLTDQPNIPTRSGPTPTDPLQQRALVADLYTWFQDHPLIRDGWRYRLEYDLFLLDASGELIFRDLPEEAERVLRLTPSEFASVQERWQYQDFPADLFVLAEPKRVDPWQPWDSDGKQVMQLYKQSLLKHLPQPLPVPVLDAVGYPLPLEQASFVNAAWTIDLGGTVMNQKRTPERLAPELQQEIGALSVLASIVARGVMQRTEGLDAARSRLAELLRKLPYLAAALSEDQPPQPTPDQSSQ